MSERGRNPPPPARRCGPGERRVYRNTHLTIQGASPGRMIAMKADVGENEAAAIFEEVTGKPLRPR